MNSIRVRGFLFGLALIIMIGAAGIQVETVTAESADTVVHPTGQYPQDMENVQTAVDAGGTVRLKATNLDGELTAFNFGPAEAGSGSVNPSVDVTILGESVESGITTIRGGGSPFESSVPVEIVIRGIHFDGPYAAAFFLGESSGAVFSFNKVTDVVGIPDWAGPGIDKAQAVWASNLDPDLIHGELIITDNYIEGVEAELGYGIALAGFSAEAHIERNEIRGTNLGGILVMLNSRDVWIEKNLIVPGSGSPTALFSLGNGIMAQWPLGGSFFVSRNTVESENPEADGIYIAATGLGFDAEDSVIEKNHVTMHNSIYSGVNLYGNVHRTLVSGNRIEGSGATALAISVIYGDETAEGNQFFHNKINLFESQVADVLLDTISLATQFDGFCGTLLDYGTDNDIYCLGEGQPPNGTAQSMAEGRRAILEMSLTLVGASPP